MKRSGLLALVLLHAGCWTEVFLPADTDAASTAAGPTDGGCDGDPDLLECDARCVDPLGDAAHCGACGAECDADERCVDGSCEFACDCDPVMEVCDGEACVCREGTERCGGDCVVLHYEPEHCGACDRDCGDEVCLDGECEPDCGALQECGGSCTDVELDPLHCGECGHICGTEEVCAFGVCRDIEEVPFACDACPCEGYCEDLDAGLLCCFSVVHDGPVCLDSPICPE